MRISFHDFDPERFSFQENPVVHLEDFWSCDETAAFRNAMNRAGKWTGLQEMPDTAEAFSRSGNWRKADVEGAERAHFMQRVLMPCVERFVDGFGNTARKLMSFNYYAYRLGDGLSLHDDMSSGQSDDPQRRRIALATYLHPRWEPDWGGELITYRRETDRAGNERLRAEHCIEPLPGSLALFTVPRDHRVARVDRLAGSNLRLSIAGWFITENSTPQPEH